MSRDFFSIYLGFLDMYKGDINVHLVNHTVWDDDGSECYGLTVWEDNEVDVFICTTESDPVDTLVHELAHVLVGWEHDHDEEWEAAYKKILDGVQ